MALSDEKLQKIIRELGKLRDLLCQISPVPTKRGTGSCGWKNVKGHKDCTCCGAWLKHWSNYTGKAQPKCSTSGCDVVAEVGAHITNKGNVVIVPMCSQHNNHNNTKEFCIKTDLELVGEQKNRKCRL